MISKNPKGKDSRLVDSNFSDSRCCSLRVLLQLLEIGLETTRFQMESLLTSLVLETNQQTK